MLFDKKVVTIAVGYGLRVPLVKKVAKKAIQHNTKEIFETLLGYGDVRTVQAACAVVADKIKRGECNPETNTELVTEIRFEMIKILEDV